MPWRDQERRSREAKAPGRSSLSLIAAAAVSSHAVARMLTGCLSVQLWYWWRIR